MASTDNRALIIAYNKNPRKCEFCGAVLEYKRRYNRFCSSSCSAKFNNPIRVRQKKKQDKKQNKCAFCGAPTKEKYCSLACMAKHRWAMLKQRIEETGMFNDTYMGEADRKTVRKYLLEKYGHACQICGLTEWMGKPIPLVVDHIDGNSKNNAVSNFRLICGNCDMQTDTYKGKNFRHGRAWRRKKEQTK